ncbi:ribonuclease H-like domain-containing protein [Tanacetum coccineum]
MYSFDMKNIVPKESLTCLDAKATSDESMLWHRRLGHINFKNINKLVKDNLDETSDILKNFIKEIENLLDKKVKIIRCDNRTEFKNKVMDDFCREKGTQGELNADVGNGEPKYATDDQNPKVNTGHFKLNTIDPSVNIVSSNDQISPKDMLTIGASHTLEATHVEFFSDKDELMDPLLNRS